MVPATTFDKTYDPVELLNDLLQRAWSRICAAYDISACCPDLSTLFQGVDLARPDLAAQMVVVNMLFEVMESVGRFSPWYKMPARAYGMASILDPLSNRTRWMLAPEAIQKWQDILEPLSLAIRKNSGLIQAILLVDGLMEDSDSQDNCVIATCACFPKRRIQIKQSILEKAEIVCDDCQQNFTIVAD